MKTQRIPGKYRYFCGIDVENTPQQLQYCSKASLEEKSLPKPKHNPQPMQAIGQNQRTVSQHSFTYDKVSRNIKTRETENALPSQTRMKYCQIMSLRISKNSPLSTPINKLQTLKYEQLIQKVNEEKIKISEIETNDSKKMQIYFPGSPKADSADFFQPIRPKRQKELEFVNPYYQSFIKVQRNTQQTKKKPIKNRQLDHGHKQKPTASQEPKSAKMYLCKMDNDQQFGQAKQIKQIKMKPRKDNAPYLAHFYEKEPQTNAMRYYPLSPNNYLQKHPTNKKTNQIYAHSASRQVEPFSHT